MEIIKFEMQIIKPEEEKAYLHSESYYRAYICAVYMGNGIYRIIKNRLFTFI